jgi:hypothetical protein
MKLMLGGQYKMCYTPKGDFNLTSTIVTHSLPPLRVAGLYNEACFARENHFTASPPEYRDSCMQMTHYNCYFDWHQLNSPHNAFTNSYNPCFFDFRTDPGTGVAVEGSQAIKGYAVYEGAKSEVSFSRRWDADFIDNGALTSSAAQRCSIHNIGNS